ncbi:hypothetical protein V1527DRAFT_451601 [Lipomyces starkeyi]
MTDKGKVNVMKTNLLVFDIVSEAFEKQRISVPALKHDERDLFHHSVIYNSRVVDFKQLMRSRFQMADMGELWCFPGIE